MTKTKRHSKTASQQNKYVVRESIEYGCKLYEVVNTVTGNRINYFADYELAKEFTRHQNNVAKKRMAD